MIKRAIKALWNLSILCTLFGLPFLAIATNLSSLFVKDKENVSKNVNGHEYFEHKGWYYGNETLICKNEGQCIEHEKAATFGVAYNNLPEYTIRKCRGKWYHIKPDGRLFDDCFSSVRGKTGFFCHIQDPFCVDAKDGTP